MTLAFGLQAVTIYALLQFADRPKMFVILSGFTFFGWGEIFSLFPALCGDFFGRKHATANYGFLYTAKGTASMFVPIGSALAAGKVFDFRADILLLLGGALVVFTVFLAPTLLHLEIVARVRAGLLAAAGALVVYGVALTVVPSIWTPFSAKFVMPKAGWSGVFAVAIVFNAVAALLAFFVLRKLNVPLGTQAAAAPAPQARAAAAAHGD